MDYPWLRLWNVMHGSPKVQLLSDRDFRAWINLLVIANQGKPRGMLPAIEHIAFHLRCTVDEAMAIMGRLHEADLMDEIDDRWSPHDWSHWQPKGDKPSTNRVREFRERCRNVSPDASTNTGNVSETVSQRFPSVSSSLTTNDSMSVSKENIIQTGNVSGNGNETFHENVDAKPCPPYPDPETSFNIIHTGGHDLTDEESQHIWRRIWSTWKDNKLQVGWYEHQRWFSAQTWHDAFAQVRKQYGVERAISIGLVEKIAADIDANGKREAKPPAPSGNGRPKSKAEERREKGKALREKLKAKWGDEWDKDDE